MFAPFVKDGCLSLLYHRSMGLGWFSLWFDSATSHDVNIKKIGGDTVTKKQRLKQQHLKPKKRLREERLKREYSEMYMADLIGLKNRRGYSEKEDGIQSFKDYEMAIIADKFGISEVELFF